MTEYAILLPGVEAHWESATDDQRTAAYARHEKFMAALAERGHQVTGGAELTNSRETRTLRLDDGELVVTQGPFAETVEQLTGFYLVRSDDLDDLIQVTGLLAESGGAVEIRACVDHADDVPD